MLAKRIIPCLDVNHGRVVKGIHFQQLQEVGDPVNLATAYEQQGADELIFLDVGATVESREIMIETVDKVSRQVFIPLTVGGGIRTEENMRTLLLAGADKVSVCTAAVKDPELISRGAGMFGSQCIVLSIDAAKVGSSWQVFINGGRQNTGIDAAAWAQQAQERGAGEILLNSIDRDGTNAGFDLELTRTISRAVSIPVIASGGAGEPAHLFAGVTEGEADAVLTASMLHYNRYTVAGLKQYMKNKGVHIR